MKATVKLGNRFGNPYNMDQYNVGVHVGIGRLAHLSFKRRNQRAGDLREVTLEMSRETATRLAHAILAAVIGRTTVEFKADDRNRPVVKKA